MSYLSKDFFRETGADGGRAAAEKMTPAERAERARKAVAARWAKHTNPKDRSKCGRKAATARHAKAKKA